MGSGIKMKSVLLFGAGYSASAWAASLPGDVIVHRTRRRMVDAATIVFDGTAPIADFATRFKDVDTILHSIPPDAATGVDPVWHWHAEDIKALPHLRWFGYLSTTAVYGDWQGDWVDETSELRGALPRARARIEAERRWLESSLPAHVFRLAGIYGAGRNALVDMREGTARRVVKPGQVFSRIHVEDIAALLNASTARPRTGAVYNGADDLPCAGHEVVTFAAELLGLTPPPYVDFERATLSPMAQSFYADCKRVRNDLMKQELGVQLRYPDYKAGLMALAGAGEGR